MFTVAIFLLCNKTASMPRTTLRSNTVQNLYDPVDLFSLSAFIGPNHEVCSIDHGIIS